MSTRDPYPPLSPEAQELGRKLRAAGVPARFETEAEKSQRLVVQVRELREQLEEAERQAQVGTKALDELVRMLPPLQLRDDYQRQVGAVVTDALVAIEGGGDGGMPTWLRSVRCSTWHGERWHALAWGHGATSGRALCGSTAVQWDEGVPFDADDPRACTRCAQAEKRRGRGCPKK